MEGQALLRIEELRVSYGGAEALSGVSLSVLPAEIVGIVGESGCGKTTLLRSIIGLLGQGGEIVSGRILFKGRDLAELGAEERRLSRGRGMAMIFQNPASSLNPSRTIGAQFLETLRSHERISKRRAFEAVAEIFRRLDFSDPAMILKSYPFELSGGMVQRTALAMAMAAKPSLMLADEPTSALDSAIQAQAAMELLKTRDRFGTAILMITHNIAAVGRLSDRVGVMYAGALVELGSRDEVLRAPAHPYTRALIAAAPRLDFRPPASLEGAPPPPWAAPGGCSFADRCQGAEKACRISRPALAPVSGRHLAACLLAGQNRAPAP